jgi:hypothetical protein
VELVSFFFSLAEEGDSFMSLLLALLIPNSHFYVFSNFLLYNPIEESTQNNFGYGLVENNDLGEFVLVMLQL